VLRNVFKNKEKVQNGNLEGIMKKITGKQFSTEISWDFINYIDDQFFQFFIKDISERKKFETEQFRFQKMESLELLAGGISHDYNNLLGTIIGSIDLLEMEHLNEEQLDICIDLKNAVNRAKDLTKQILYFAIGGYSKITRTPLSKIVRESASLVFRGVDPIYDINSSNEDIYVDVDIGQINQVINNLLINAIQAMPNSGKVTIFIELIDNGNQISNTLENKPYAKISIQDSGIGISKKNQLKIFSPYFTTKERGSGLGLTSCYRIIQDHKGYITFNSIEGEGTTFYIYLPLSKEI
jgi:signal transduction histidine kinase